jgi:hypothetical protein
MLGMGCSGGCWLGVWKPQATVAINFTAATAERGRSRDRAAVAGSMQFAR